MDDGSMNPPALTAISPMGLHARGASRALVGRPAELSAIGQELAVAKNGQVAALTFEGEPGIGKTRLLVAAADAAAAEGFVPVSVAADEEIRGPFLLARAVLASRDADQAADAAVRAALGHALDAISGRDMPELEGLSADQKLLRAFDLGAVAVRALATHVPLALLVDDLQWADEDSVRLLRYVVRSAADVPLFLVLAVRPEEMAQAAEVSALLADMQRMGLVRRLRLDRLTQQESAELLKHAMGGSVDPTSAAMMHVQAEGVPFILEELSRAYRDGGLVQQIDGVWRLARNAQRLVPSAVRTLIQRRAAHLPADTRAVLAEAAILGRSFSVRDLQAVKQQLGDDRSQEMLALADALVPAVAAGLLLELPASSPADYRFAHEQVRHFAAASLTPPRRRALHRGVVDILTAGGDPPSESLALIADHALAAGDSERAARYACEAAQAALAARAPEEVLRIVEAALPAVSKAQDRLTLLTARDDALDMLRRPVDRLEGLAELAALAEAIGDRHLQLDTMLRRAAALRVAEEEDQAAQLARDVRQRAEAAGDRRAELAACLELGQVLLRRPIGESFGPPAREVDLDLAAEAYERAEALASALDDRPALAAANRELGVIGVSRAREVFVDLERRGEHLPLLERILAGEPAMAVFAETPVGPIAVAAEERLQRAIDLYEEAGDRRGMMSSIIAMAYIPMGLDIHVHGSGQRIEEIRRLATQLRSLTLESERDRAEAQMLYGVHVFARAKGVADLALSRGEEAYHKARVLGDQSLEFAAAGGVALAYLDLGELARAEAWIGRAAATASASPTPFRTRQLALWRGQCLAAAGDGARMREHLERAIDLGQGRPAARCEALARLALAAARLGGQAGDLGLLQLARRSAQEVEEIMPLLPGQPLWGAQAAAALALVALAQGDAAAAADAGRRVLGALEAAHLEDLHLEMLLPAARALLAGGSVEERTMAGMNLRMTLAFVAQRILDEDVRVRWFQGPFGRELTELAGPLEVPPRAGDGGGPGPAATLDEEETQLLRMLVEGRTNRQMAEILGVDEDALASRLARFHAKIGTTSRAQATLFAFQERVI
jgi:DNA-binding NarL/FixJ family response regulator